MLIMNEKDFQIYAGLLGIRSVYVPPEINRAGLDPGAAADPLAGCETLLATTLRTALASGGLHIASDEEVARRAYDGTAALGLVVDTPAQIGDGEVLPMILTLCVNRPGSFIVRGQPWTLSACVFPQQCAIWPPVSEALPEAERLLKNMAFALIHWWGRINRLSDSEILAVTRPAGSTN